MAKNKSTKTKKITEVKNTQKISAFFKKIEPKDIDDDFQSSKFTKSSSSVVISENSENVIKNDGKSSDIGKNKTNENKKIEVIKINLNDSDEDFVSSHLEKFKQKHKDLFKKNNFVGDRNVNKKKNVKDVNTKSIDKKVEEFKDVERLMSNISEPQTKANKIVKKSNKNESKSKSEESKAAEEEPLQKIGLDDENKQVNTKDGLVRNATDQKLHEFQKISAKSSAVIKSGLSKSTSVNYEAVEEEIMEELRESCNKNFGKSPKNVDAGGMSKYCQSVEISDDEQNVNHDNIKSKESHVSDIKTGGQKFKSEMLQKNCAFVKSDSSELRNINYEAIEGEILQELRASCSKNVKKSPKNSVDAGGTSKHFLCQTIEISDDERSVNRYNIKNSPSVGDIKVTETKLFETEKESPKSGAFFRNYDVNYEEAEKEIVQGLHEISSKNCKKSLKNSVEGTSKHFSNTRNDLTDNESNLVINLDNNDPPLIPKNKEIPVITPEKSYLKCDQVLNDVTNTDKRVTDTVFDGVTFIDSSPKTSPPHSTPIPNLKKRKTPDDFPDIIPATPEEETKRKSKRGVEKKFNGKISFKNSNDVTSEMITSPPRKLRKISGHEKQVINLADITEEEFVKIHSCKYKNGSEIIDDVAENGVKDRPIGNQEFKCRPITAYLSPPKKACSPIKNQGISSPIGKHLSPSRSFIPPITIQNGEEVVVLRKTPKKACSPIKNPITKYLSPSRSSIPPITNQNEEEVIVLHKTPTNSPKKCTKSPKKLTDSPNSLKSTSLFIVSPAKNMSPSKWSPFPGTKTPTPKKNAVISPRKLDFCKNQPKIDLFIRSPSKSTNTLVTYKDVPSGCTFRSPLKDNVCDVNFDDSWDANFEINLNLEEWQYCKVVDVTMDVYQNLILHLEALDIKLKASCVLQGVWRHLRLKIGDKVNLIASKTDDDVPYCVNNDYGFVVYEPDFLISGTSIVGSLFCKRRGVLSDRFRGVDSGNQAMIVGSLVHRLLQEVLKRKIDKIEQVEKLLISFLNDKDMLFTAYSSQISIEAIKEHTLQYIPRIVEFIERYVTGKTTKSDPKNWKGVIETIQDIEENIWCAELGIKGKVDVTVKTTRKDSAQAFNALLPQAKDATFILPLELKTGRPTFSSEHRGQIILYTMMMTELGYKVDAGLLLYLRDGILREVESKHNEKRDLIMLRNDLAYYLKKQPDLPKDCDIPDDKSDSSKMSSRSSVMSEENPLRQLNFSELPPPINHHSACGKCPYSTICVTFLSRDASYTLSESHPLYPISKGISYLEPSHVDYVIHWSALVHLESTYKPAIKELKDIWRLPPTEREKIGKALSYLVLCAPVVEKTEPFVHHFKRNDTKKEFKHDFISSGLVVGNYVVVSTDKRIAIAAGFVSKLTKDEIAVGLERNLSERYSNNLFHIDTYESQTIFNYTMTSIATLLEDTPKIKRLRELIVDKQPPRFINKLSRSVALTGGSILKRLNKIQQRAVLKSLTAEDYLLIKGMPGTGKTATIVALIQLLVQLKKTVLITSHTNSAVDNVCLRLLEHGVDVLRLGSETRVHPLVKHCLESVKTCSCKTVEEIEAVYNRAQVIAVTCLGANHPVLSQRILDVCIVDESTQVLQCSVFRALQATKTFILIGDPDQLPPVVSNPEAVLRGMTESLFQRLDSPDSTITLTLQYRMNKIITDLANAITYKGQLLCADDSVGCATLRLPNPERLKTVYLNETWVTNILDVKLNQSVIGIDTGEIWKKLTAEGRIDPLEDVKVPVQNVQEDEERIFENKYEAAIVITIIEALKEAGLKSESIGIIAPYRAQVTLLKKIMVNMEGKESNEGVEVNTVDQYQGRDKDVIIYSCTKSKDTSKPRPKASFEILEDKRRLTVAITRAKHKLIVIGDFCTLKTYSPFKLLLNAFQTHQIFSIPSESSGFSWNKVMERLKKYDA